MTSLQRKMKKKDQQPRIWTNIWPQW